MKNAHQLPKNNIREYMVSGQATLTLQNEKTGKHFTYRLTAPGRTAEERTEAKLLFVSVLTGPDNTNNYTYAGIVFRDSLIFKSTAKSRISEDALAVQSFKWLTKRIIKGDLDRFPSVNAYHHNHCGRCGRLLTVPESIETGLGPVCAGKTRT